jgi:hypothetical protein
VKNIVDLARIEDVADILLEKLKARLVPQVREVLYAPSQQVVGTHHRVPFRQQSIAQMGTEKPGSARHQHTHALPLSTAPARKAYSFGKVGDVSVITVRCPMPSV